MTPKPKHPELLRNLTAIEAASIVVGTIIGSGIFLVPSAMVREVGSFGMVLVVFVAGGLLSLAGALTYAELGAAMPEAGGEYIYLREAYGPMWSFLYGWTHFWVAKSGSIAALATAFFYYLANFWPRLERVWFTLPIPLGDGGGPLPISYGQILAMGLILGLGGVNFFGVKAGGRVQSAITILKIGLILGIVLLTAAFGGGSAENWSSQTAHVGGVSGFFAALVAALWAYDGWNNVTMASGEVRDPHRNIPRALIGGVLTVIAVYLAVNVAYFYSLDADSVAASERVASDAARRFLGERGADAVSLAAMISIFAALNGSILSGARVPYAMARDGFFLESMAAVHPQFRTPHVAIAALSTWAALLVLSGRYDQLYTYVIFASWILYGLSAASVFVLRRKRPDLERPYRALGYPAVPAAFVVVAAALVGMTLVTSPRESLLGLALILLGAPFYFWRKRRNSFS
ncbi:MAG: amino acid permease [Acidobacteria bacterium]|nr:amino acid permease [Acidobacteriota bacterium]